MVGGGRFEDSIWSNAGGSQESLAGVIIPFDLKIDEYMR